MSARPRFHLDEHVAAAVAHALHQRGIDVPTSAECGTTGYADEAHLAFAAQQGRVMVTHDADYIRLHSQGTEHAGIAYCHQHRAGVGELARSLVMLWEIMTADEMRNHLEFL